MPYHFRLPLYTELTAAQMAVLDEIGPVAISGGPGTGKSIVSLWRHVRNHSLGARQSIMLTYTKTLQAYLSNCARTVSNAAGSDVRRITSWHGPFYEEIIVDEAQDVELNKYQELRNLGRHISFGADDQQILYPGRGTTTSQLTAMFPDNHIYELDENFRNSFEIMNFTRAALPNRLISNVTMTALRQLRSTGVKPKCIVNGYDTKKQENDVLNIIREFQSDTHNIGILVPLNRQVDSWHKFLRENEITSSKYFHDGDEINEMENVHVTTFKSAKGIEFDTVILPNFHRWRSNIGSLYVVEENDYYVAFTRAKRNLYLLSATNQLSIHTDTFETIIS